MQLQSLRLWAYLYGQKLTVFTDHASVKLMLEVPNPSSKHARWWTKVFGSGVKKVDIKYRPGKHNHVADALSRCPSGDAPQVGIAEGEVRVACVTSQDQDQGGSTIQTLLQYQPVTDFRGVPRRVSRGFQKPFMKMGLPCERLNHCKVMGGHFSGKSIH